MQQPRRREQSNPDPLVVILLALGNLLIFPCVLLVLLSRWLPRRLRERRGFWLLVALIGALCFLCFVLLLSPFRTLYNQLVKLLGEVIREAEAGHWSMLKLWIDLRPIWLESLLCAPGAAFLMHLFTPKSAEQRLLAPRQQQDAARRAASKRLQRKIARHLIPDQVRNEVVIGLPLQGDLTEWIIKGLFILPTPELSKHGIVLGASGSGKSETLLRMAVGAARVLGWQVIYIDGKGDEDAAMRFIAAMRSAGVRQVKMFPAEAYNGWVGSREALLSRLLAVEEYSDTHYRAVAENLLRLALNAPGPAVKTSADILVRLNLTNELLLGLYAGHPEEEAYLTYLARKDPLGVYNRYAALLGKLQGKLDGTWSYDSVDAAYVSLDGLALSGIISGLGRYFVEDFANYAGQRKPKQRRVLFIFDDLGAVDADLANMFERVRSRGVSVFVSGQSDHSIAYKGFLQNANRIRSAATTIILHASNHPENMIAAAGTELVIEASSNIAGEEATGYGTLHIKEIPKVDSNAVRELPVGEAYVIAHGRAHRVHVAPVQVSATLLTEAEAYINQIAQKGLPGQARPAATLASAHATDTISKADRDPSVQSASLPGEIRSEDQDEDILT